MPDDQIALKDPVQEETQDELDNAVKTLQSLKGPDGQMLKMGKVELSLLQKMLSTATEEFREEQIFRMMDFMNEDEAADHVAAYYEAKDLGMDTSFNVANMFALCSVNRRGSFSHNLIAILTETLQYGKWPTSQRNGKNGSSGKGSPLGN